jgi:DNA-binding transcriptional ArsR family regulator
MREMPRNAVGSNVVFTAVADPTRRAMLDLLAKRPRSAGEIVSQFPNLTQPGVSRHLHVLREAQLVGVTVNAQRRIYALKPEGLRELHQWISRYQDFWIDKLDALEHHLESKTFKRGAEKEK